MSHTVSLSRSNQSDRHPAIKPQATSSALEPLSLVVSRWMEAKEAENYGKAPSIAREHLDEVEFTREYNGPNGVKLKATFCFDPNSGGLDDLAARALIGRGKNGEAKLEGKAECYSGALTVKVRRK